MGRRRKSMLPVGFAGGLDAAHTAFAGAGLLMEAYHQAGIGERAERVLPPKGYPKGLTQGQMVECFVVGSALGMDCLEDMERLRQNRGLAAMLGYTLPAPETAQQWLDRFHDQGLTAGRPAQESFLPPESSGLAGLKKVNRGVIAAYAEAVKPEAGVTLDVDASLVETSKANARYCYQGYKAYQPIEVSWAETGLVVGDEFREGNVGAGKDIKRVVDEAYQMLPGRPWRVRIRSDSAAYQQEALDHWQERGWVFAVSADLSPQLREAMMALPEESWHLWQKESGRVIREWAEVPYAPSRS